MAWNRLHDNKVTSEEKECLMVTESCNEVEKRGGEERGRSREGRILIDNSAMGYFFSRSYL